MKQFYKDTRFYSETLVLIETMNRIVASYVRQGYRLTVRQLYYQLVARDIIENTERSYKRITATVNDARMAGLMDWDAIEDRTRAFLYNSHWRDGSHILTDAADWYYEDMWDSQDGRVFVVVEKEALVGVLERVCRLFDVPLLAARGYPSGTVLREFVERDILNAAARGQYCQILHFGDHDPSGIDMSRDLEERFRLFAGDDEECITFERIALNMDQIHEQKPPENPAKTTDSRFKGYKRKYGESSWELDALTPEYLTQLVEQNVRPHIDDERWEQAEARIERVKEKLRDAAQRFTDEDEQP